ncbi:MAG: fructosamine kinase family protein [Niabella sp.]
MNSDILQELQLTDAHIQEVHGGDINRTWCVQTKSKWYFLKINDANRYPDMFAREATGLNVLRGMSTLQVPEVLRHGIINGQQYLLMEWLNKDIPQPGFWDIFGEKLAQMHQIPQPFFGFEEDNYIGSLPQHNERHESWKNFYANCRILPLIRSLYNSGSVDRNSVQHAERFCQRLGDIFPAEPPALLHGDLWSGNFMATANNEAAIFDPAVYYGHREMDIAMTRLFGGFDKKFYEGYQATYPLAKGWEERLPFAQLYPLLVHAILFGGHYVYDVCQILMKF